MASHELMGEEGRAAATAATSTSVVIATASGHIQGRESSKGGIDVCQGCQQKRSTSSFPSSPTLHQPYKAFSSSSISFAPLRQQQQHSSLFSSPLASSSFVRQQQQQQQCDSPFSSSFASSSSSSLYNRSRRPYSSASSSLLPPAKTSVSSSYIRSPSRNSSLIGRMEGYHSSRTTYSSTSIGIRRQSFHTDLPRQGLGDYRSTSSSSGKTGSSGNGSSSTTPPPSSSGGGNSGSSSGGGGGEKGGGGSSGDGNSKLSSNPVGAKATKILHQGTIMYEDVEKIIMKQIRATNQNRFRIGFASTLLVTVWVITTFGKQIRSFFSRHTAEVAKETLQNEALQIQTRELSAAVVQFILTDPEILSKTSSFLKEAADNPETQKSLVDLAKHVFTHPETLEVVVELARKLVPRVLQSQETVDQVGVLMSKVILEAEVKEAAVVLVQELIQDPEVYQAVLAFSARLIEEDSVKEAVNQLLINSSHKVLEDAEVVDHSKNFVAEVVADDSLQRTGGTAIWNSLQYSFQPKLIRVLWFGLLCGVVAFMRNNTRSPGGGAFG